MSCPCLQRLLVGVVRVLLKPGLMAVVLQHVLNGEAPSSYGAVYMKTCRLAYNLQLYFL